MAVATCGSEGRHPGFTAAEDNNGVSRYADTRKAVVRKREAWNSSHQYYTHKCNAIPEKKEKKSEAPAAELTRSILMSG